MQKLVNFIYLFLLIFCPLAFGTTGAWSLAIMELFCFLAVFFYLLNQWYRKQPVYQTPGLTPLLLFLGYILFQILPLPPWLLELLSPNTFRLYSDTIGIIDSDSWLSISINKRSTLLEFFRYASYVGFYFLTVQLLSTKEKLQSVVSLVVIFLTALSAFSIIQYFTSKNTIFWLIEVPKNSIIFGPYVNHNHFAGLMELALPMVIALFFYLKPKISYKQTWREKIVEMFDFQGVNLYLLLGFSALIIASSIVLSLSRGGMISASLSAVLLAILVSTRFKKKKVNLIIFLLLISVFLSVSWFGWEGVLARFAKIQNQQGEINDARLDFWKDSILIVKSSPLVGFGFGTFSDIYPVFRTFIHERAVWHAHNDYLELMIEGGIIGLLIVLWFWGQLLKSSFKIFRKRHDRYAIYLFLGCFTGLFSLFIHSITDFNLHIGANGLYFFFMTGLMVVAIHTQYRIQSRRTILNVIGNRKFILGATCTVLIVIIAGGSLNTRKLFGHFYYKSISEINLNGRMPREKLEKVNRIASLAVQWDSTLADYHYAKANIQTLMLDADNALNSFKLALIQQPIKGEYLQRVGLVYSWLGDEITAEKLLLAGIKTDGNRPERYQDYASWLFSKNRTTEGLQYLKTALSLEPYPTLKKTREYVISMLVNGMDDREVLDAFPKKVKPLLGVAEYYNSIKEFEQAESVYRLALEFIKTDRRRKVLEYGRIHNFFLRRGKLKDALDVALKATEDMPYEWRPRVWAGRIYKKLGVVYRATEEYKMALALDPSNKYAIRELKSLIR